MAISRKKMDEYFMRRALSLALQGTRRTSPNPLVGCVVVRDGMILSEGWHARYGGAHAERAALDRLPSAHGATVYVNLEPCAHHGKTPPCAPYIVEKGAARVVLGMVDPDERVRGRGIAILEAAGVAVERGVLEEECRWINRGFIRRTTMNRPWVTAKAAVSLDGGMALLGGESRWITSPEARAVAHLLRAENDAVLVGVGTVARDDPELTVRHTVGPDPLRVVLDARCSMSPGARVAKGALVFVGAEADEGRCSDLRGHGAEVVAIPGDGGRLALPAVLAALADRGVSSLLVEGGPTVLSSFIREGLVDAFVLFLSPRIMGRSISMGGDLTFSSMDETLRLRTRAVRPVGDDLLLEGVPTCSPAL